MSVKADGPNASWIRVGGSLLSSTRPELVAFVDSPLFGIPLIPILCDILSDDSPAR